MVSRATDEYASESLSRDEAFEYVASERRRILVQVLLENDGEQAVDDIAEEVARRQSIDDTGGESHDGHYEELRIALLHHDLPKLDEGDVVEYDYDEETVTPQDAIEDLEQFVPDE